MTLTKIPGSSIVDGTITSADITDSTITNAKMAVDPANASNLSSGSVPAAQLDNVDLTAQKGDIALLAFKTQANGNLSRYNLVDQSVDAFEDASGVNASASTGENRSSGNYYSGAAPTNATGGTITQVGGNYIHTFGVGSTNFVVPGSANVSWLVVAGGGAAGYDAGGGGGGGGFRTGANHPVTAQTYGIVVGAGGTAPTNNSTPSTTGNGGNSTFDTVTSNGGGGGGSSGGGYQPGGAGGSGGGTRMRTDAFPGAAGNTPAISPITGETTTVQGFAGGCNTAPSGGSNSTSGGGGGASQVGYQGTASQSSGTWGNGGDGTASSISGASVTYAGGGGGGGGSPGDGGNGVVIISYSEGAFATYTDMTLVSNSVTAEAQPTKADVVLTYTNGAGTATINTDLIASVSRDGGTTYTAVTLASQGTTGGETILSASDISISGQPAGTSMVWKVATANQSVSKRTRIHGVSLGWS